MKILRSIVSKCRVKIILILMLFSLALGFVAIDVANTDVLNIKPFVEYLKDDSLSYSIDNLASENIAGLFRDVQKMKTLDFGYTNSRIWLRFKLANYNPSKRELVILVDNPLLDKVSLFASRKNGEYKVLNTGDKVNILDKKFKIRQILFDLPLELNESKYIYLSAESEGTLKIPTYIYEKAIFFKHLVLTEILFGIFFGIIVFMVIYNILFGWIFRSRVYFSLAFS